MEITPLAPAAPAARVAPAKRARAAPAVRAAPAAHPDWAAGLARLAAAEDSDPPEDSDSPEDDDVEPERARPTLELIAEKVEFLCSEDGLDGFDLDELTRLNEMEPYQRGDVEEELKALAAKEPPLIILNAGRYDYPPHEYIHPHAQNDLVPV